MPRAPVLKRALATCWLGLVPATLLAAAPQSELDSTLRELKQSRDQQTALKKKRDSIAGELKNLQSDSIVLAAQMQRMESEIATKEKALTSLQTQLRQKQTDMQSRQSDTAALLHAMIRMQRMPRAMVIAQPGDTQQILQTAGALRVAYGGVEQKMHELQTQMNELKTLETAVVTTRDDLDSERKALRGKQASLNATLTERGTLLRSVNADYDKLEARINSLSRSSQSLSELIQNIEKEKTLFDQITPQPKPQAPGSKPSATPAPSGASFTATKGRLPYPAAGSLLHRFGERKGKVDRYQGHVLQTVAGANVTAPHSGKVVFTGKFMDYGNMAIIEHGGGYHSLIAGLSVVRASLGQSVAAGEPIGSMGDAPQARQLYLELRKDSKAIDPTPWMGNLSKAIATR